MLVLRVLGASAVIAAAVVSVGSGARSASAAFDCASGGATYAVRAGDSWYGIADRVDVDVDNLLAANDADTSDTLLVGDTLCLPAGADLSGACAVSYTVVAGDGWAAIARRAGTTLAKVLGLNGGDVNRVIHPGDVVCLPAGTRMTQKRAADVRLDALPVQGPCWYFDTWRVDRGGGRRHLGVDIMAAEGNYVYAVADGRITGKAWDIPGRISGNALELTVANGTFFFYAHLLDFAPGIKVGAYVEAGEIIGWVGETGNASGPNLHFEVHPGGGDAVNPYPIVRAAGGCTR